MPACWTFLFIINGLDEARLTKRMTASCGNWFEKHAHAYCALEAGQSFNLKMYNGLREIYVCVLP